jgi:hypothetical protein
VPESRFFLIFVMKDPSKNKKEKRKELHHLLSASVSVLEELLVAMETSSCLVVELHALTNSLLDLASDGTSVHVVLAVGGRSEDRLIGSISREVRVPDSSPDDKKAN